MIAYVQGVYGYTMKYEKAWKAKEATFRILYSDWKESDNRLPMLLRAVAATNLEMYHVVEPFRSGTMMPKGEPVSQQWNMGFP